MRTTLSVAVLATALAAITTSRSQTGAQGQSASNANGDVRTVASNGSIDRRNAFFRPLGKQYAVTCEHCHFASDGWGVSAEHIRQLFNTTQGKHPIFSAPSANDFHSALTLGN